MILLNEIKEYQKKQTAYLRQIEKAICSSKCGNKLINADCLNDDETKMLQKAMEEIIVRQ